SRLLSLHHTLLKIAEAKLTVFAHGALRLLPSLLHILSPFPRFSLVPLLLQITSMLIGLALLPLAILLLHPNQ
ncbi:hypothetical protein, partial [Candidatus Synechococcus spongiarum]|uniref:hypothetical protein n=1 Tax=Candidatus Synechococcus spongiarum TaxID=431041 RepID=UPI001C574AA9